MNHLTAFIPLPLTTPGHTRPQPHFHTKVTIRHSFILAEGPIEVPPPKVHPPFENAPRDAQRFEVGPTG